MSYKHYFPTFRARALFLRRALTEIGHVKRILHIGCGEGDHDRAIKAHCESLVASDLNAGDIAHARELNRGIAGIEYRVEDATWLQTTGSFDAVVCMEVIEHVCDPPRMLREIARVLVPGGRCVLTCPSERFPVTYDPINFVLDKLGTHISVGAYAWGHDWLVCEAQLHDWLRTAGLRAEREERLTGWIAGAAECYWPGLAQRIVKANSGNTAGSARVALRPGGDCDPPRVGLVDALISADRALAGRGGRSVGLGYLLERI